MSYLKSNGFTCISLEQLYDSGYLRSKFPSKPIVITLDDGYDDNYTTAYPILKKYGFTASVFMISSYINGDKFMSLAQLKELSNSGWEIEDHTVNHVSLTTVDSNTVINEITKSKEDLEKEIGKPVDFIAYPDGTYNDNIMNLTRNAGYKIAVTTERGYANDSTDPMRIHRVYCYANMGITEFSKRVNNPNY
ncbi:Putative xylanase/chitin deacetylase (fragment) [Candidatus Desulfosporosinus infrequens]|uniref:Xylanase/chitin deacetylase n=1 Tax=Candidatus Desulfosporosinus infrequens TaxID=2043169 RepID=A0A2U3L6M5_9FIRM